MLLDLVALGLLILFALMGALRGGLASATSLATLLLSYGAAVWAAQNLGAGISEKLGWPPYLAAPAAGTAAFIVTAVFGGVLGMAIKSWAKSFRGDSPIGTANRWFGGFLGVVRGGLIVLLLSWLAIWVDAARQTGAFSGLDGAPEVDSSAVVKITEKVVASAVAVAMDGDTTTEDVLSRFASRPGAAVRSLQAILADPRIEALQHDRFFWTLIENGAHARAMNQVSFQKIARDEKLRAQLADIGVISEEAAHDPKVFRAAFAEVLAEVGPRVKGLINDPDMTRLARDPEVISLLESGDALGLIRHQGIQQLVAKVSQR